MLNFYNGVKTHAKICKIRIFVIFYKKKIKELIKKRKELKEMIQQFIKKFSKSSLIDAKRPRTRRRRSSDFNGLNGIDIDEVLDMLEPNTE